MRTVSFSNERVQNLLNNYFVNTFTNTTGDSTAGSSFEHSPNDQPGQCIRGNGKQNVQTIFMTPTGKIFHVATGFLPPEDLVAEIEFAGELFAAMQKENNSTSDLVVNAHQNRLKNLGFSEEEINSRDGMEMFTMMRDQMNSQNSNNNSSGNRLSNDQPFSGFIKGQFLADNKFSIRNPLMDVSTFEANPGSLVGNGNSFFGSSSNSSSR